MSGKSTASNLINVTQYDSNCLDKHLLVDVIYTDFSKTIDPINHDLLLAKLNGLAFSDDFKELLRSYL